MGNMRTEGGLYLPKVTLLPGVEWKPNSGRVTPGPVLFPQRPRVATAPRCRCSGGRWNHKPQREALIEPPASRPWERAVFPLTGTQLSLSQEFHHLRPQIPKAETAGQLSVYHRPGLPGIRAWWSISGPRHQDQKLGLPGSTPHRPDGFPSTRLSPRRSFH